MSSTLASHGSTPQWPVKHCTVNAHRGAGVHFHVTFGGDRFDARERTPSWNRTVHESVRWHTEQGFRYSSLMSDVTVMPDGGTPAPVWLDIRRGGGPDRIESGTTGRVEIEFIADRYGDSQPLMLQVGCQRFRPGLMLNNGGSVSATDNPDKFRVTVVGDLNAYGDFTVRPRAGGEPRSVSRSDLNAYVERARVLTSPSEQVEMRGGVFRCEAPGHDHGVFVASNDSEDRSRLRVARLRDDNAGYVVGEKGFASWADCRPVRVGSFADMFGPTTGRERRLRVEVTTNQFYGVERAT